ncbi:MAG: hypothetical protein CFH26_00662 [Alphaproteobacteria bacterium MarineAlpha6_Bin4]|nr:MAG: hypothetical protein CFH26_00662 [Alphaproteobacteria bacterium MarineAlpha6_Bin4]
MPVDKKAKSIIETPIGIPIVIIELSEIFFPNTSGKNATSSIKEKYVKSVMVESVQQTNDFLFIKNLKSLLFKIFFSKRELIE